MGKRSIHVVVNPAAGQSEPILYTLNKVFNECDFEWDISLTKQAGDAARQARAAAQRGVDIVAAYGGDGTVAEVASGLVDSGVPLAIFPGGTANVMSVELGIPADLESAARAACDPNSSVRQVDAGVVNDHFFLLRVGIGFEAAMVESADRELKDRYGVFAYLWSALQNLRQPEISHYNLALDGNELEIEGLTCMIANSGNMGQAGVNLIPDIDIGDGLLDVVVIQSASLRSLFEVVGAVSGLKQVADDSTMPAHTVAGGEPGQLTRWRVKEVRVRQTPEQVVQYDGEVLGKGEVSARVLPGAVRVIVPAPPAE